LGGNALSAIDSTFGSPDPQRPGIRSRGRKLQLGWGPLLPTDAVDTDWLKAQAPPHGPKELQLVLARPARHTGSVCFRASSSIRPTAGARVSLHANASGGMARPCAISLSVLTGARAKQIKPGRAREKNKSAASFSG